MSDRTVSVPQADVDRTTLQIDVNGVWPKPAHHVLSFDHTDPRHTPLPAIAGYDLLRTLGRGGMGVVYLATEIALHRPVALKVVASGLFADVELHERFQREAEAIACLQHPNIVQIYHVGRTDGGSVGAVCVPYIALEYANAGSLAVHVGKAMSPRTAARIVATLATTIQYAHDCGIVHRDLKPGNIMLHSVDPARTEPQYLDSQIPKVTDFGLAKRIGQGHTDSQTVAGTVLGTPEYMAPEQTGDAVPVGQTADVYALGVLLYELLTGRVPFQGVDAISTLAMVRLQEPVAPSRLQSRLPRDLDTICQRCLEKAPSRRYASASALAADLQAWLEGRPIAARPVNPIERAWKIAQRRPAIASLLVAVVGLTWGGVAGVFWQWQRAEARAVDERRARDDASQALDASERNLYFGRVHIAQHELAVGSQADAVRGLESCRPTDGKIDHRGWEWHYLKNASHCEQLAFRASSHWVWDIAYSPDGRFLATAAGTPHFPDAKSTPGELALWDAQTGQLIRRLIGHRGTVRRVQFSPDGRLLCSSGYDQTVRVWEVDSGLPIGEPMAGVIRFHAYRSTYYDSSVCWFSRDSRSLMFQGPSGWQRCDLQSRETFTLAMNGDGLAMSGDANCVALRRGDHDLDVVSLDTPRTLGELRLDYGLDRAALSADGRTIVVGSYERVELHDVATGQRKRLFAGPAGFIETLAISPDGRRVAAAGADRVVYVWDLHTLFHVMYHGHQSHIRQLAFSPDNKSLISCDGSGMIYQWDLARNPRQQLVHSGASADSISAVGLTEDGQQLLATDIRQQLKRFDLAGNLVSISRLDGLTQQVRYPRADVQFNRVGTNVFAPLDGDRSSARCWDAVSGKTVQNYSGHTLPITSVALSDDTRRLATTAIKRGSPGGVGELIVWDAASGAKLWTITTESAVCAALTTDGGRLAAVTRGGEVIVWAVAERREQWRRPAFAPGDGTSGGVMVLALTFSPDGTALAAGNYHDGMVRVWQADTGRPLLPDLMTKPSLTGITFTPDSRRVVAAGYDSEVRMWDVATGQLAITLPPPTGLRPGDVAFTARPVFSRRHQRLAMLDWRGFLACWDGKPSEDSATMINH